MVQLDLDVCDKLAALVTLGCDFSDRFVPAIRPRAKTMEMEKDSTIPIVRKPLKRASRKLVPMPAAQKMHNKDVVATKLRIAH